MRIEGISTTPTIQKPQMGNKTEENNSEVIKKKSAELPMNNPTDGEQKRPSEEEIIRAIESANKSVKVYDRRLEFSIHEATKEIMVKVIDTNTDEVIREIPPEKILDMVAKMWEMAGILVDRKI